MKEERVQTWLKWLSWILAGVYISSLLVWSILDPSGFQELEGLALLPGLFIGLFVITTTVRSDG